MANYDRHLDFNSSMGVSKISPKDPPLSPIDSSPGGGGGLTDSGFETFDLLSSPNSQHNNGDDSLSEGPYVVHHVVHRHLNGKSHSPTNNGLGIGDNEHLEHDFYEPDPEDEDEDDEELFDSMVSSPPKSDGRKALNGPSRDFTDLNFFDPLAPLPEEFPSPQESSSPQKFPSSPSKDIPEEVEEYSNSPNDVERDYFEGDEDSPYNPSSPQPDTDEPHDSLSDSNTGSFPCADVTASPKDVPLHCYPSRDLVVNAPQLPQSHGDSGTECDSLEDPPVVHAHAPIDDDDLQHELQIQHGAAADSPHVSGALHDVSSADERTVNDRTYVDRNKLKKKKEPEPVSIPEIPDLKVKRSKSEVKVSRRTTESEKENITVKPIPTAKPAPVVAAKPTPTVVVVAKQPAPPAPKSTTTKQTTVTESKTPTGKTTTTKTSVVVESKTPNSKTTTTKTSVVVESKSTSTAQLEHDDEEEVTRPIEDEDDDLIEEMEEMPVHTSSVQSRTFTSEVQLPERTEAKVVATGVSIEALKSTYSTDVVKEEDNKSKEHIETGISIQQLKSTYLHSGHIEPEEDKPSLGDKEVVSTGVDIKTLKASYCQLAQQEDPLKSSGPKEKIETGVSIKALCASYGDLSKFDEEDSSDSTPLSIRAQRARSVGDLSKLEPFNKMDNAHATPVSVHTLTSKSHNDLRRMEETSASSSDVIHTGVSVKALRASYCNLIKMEDNRSRETLVQTGINIRNLKTSFSTTDANEDPGVKIDRARITRSFSQVNTEETPSMEDVYPLYAMLDANDSVMGKDEKANLCRICGKPVFLMDRIKAEKGVFHKGCFRCAECSKQLTVDNYSSHEGVVYCKPHFKTLFQPKANFEEDTAHVIPRPRRHELIIKENTPMELPPDVIRSSDKTDYGLEELPSLRNIKSRFELGEGDGDLVRSSSQVSVKRSESILSRMAKFQSLNENGHYEDSDSSSEDEETRDPDVIRETRKKEKLHVRTQESSSEVVFSGMTDLKSQWENGSDRKTKEEYHKETQEELNKLRQRICHMSPEGKGNLKAVYENAVQESEKMPEKVAYLETHELLGGIKEKWERGEVLNEVEQEKLDKYNKEREDDLSVFDLGTSSEARTIFKKIDETVVKTGSTVLKKSPSIDRSRSTREVLYSNHTNSVPDGVEVVRSGEHKDEVIVDPTVLHEKFKFFENYQDPSKQERKRFTITPPRETERGESPEVEISRDPNVVRACDQEGDIIVTDTAKKMLNKFRELESQSERDDAPQGPKPLKRITPPREYTTYSDHDSSPEPERDPNIVRACDKIEDTIMIEAERTRSLRAKFENWEDNDVESENYRNLQDDVVQPSIDTAKNLKAKFEALREENAAKPVDTPKHKVNRFVDYTGSGVEQCAICGKRVYAMEKVEAVGHKFHKACFKCSQCSCILRLDNYTTSEGVLYCTPHFKQLFITKGNYDEGFGREQHKEKWNRSRSTTPTSKELSGFNGNGEYSETEEIYA